MEPKIEKIERLNIDIEESLKFEIKKRALYRNISLKKYVKIALAEFMKQEDDTRNEK